MYEVHRSFLKRKNYWKILFNAVFSFGLISPKSENVWGNFSSGKNIFLVGSVPSLYCFTPAIFIGWLSPCLGLSSSWHFPPASSPEAVEFCCVGGLCWLMLSIARVGLGDPQRSLPTPTILWFCETGSGPCWGFCATAPILKRPYFAPLAAPRFWGWGSPLLSQQDSPLRLRGPVLLGQVGDRGCFQRLCRLSQEGLSQPAVLAYTAFTFK